MQILSRFKKQPEIPSLNKGCVVQIFLDDSVLRMCQKYSVYAPDFMKSALMEELHVKAITRESICFQENHK